MVNQPAGSLSISTPLTQGLSRCRRTRRIGEGNRFTAWLFSDWTGQYRATQRVVERLTVVVPATFAIILLLLYLAFKRWSEVLITVLTLPLALTGAVWFLGLWTTPCQ